MLRPGFYLPAAPALLALLLTPGTSAAQSLYGRPYGGYSYGRPYGQGGGYGYRPGYGGLGLGRVYDYPGRFNNPSYAPRYYLDQDRAQETLDRGFNNSSYAPRYSPSPTDYPPRYDAT